MEKFKNPFTDHYEKSREQIKTYDFMPHHELQMWDLAESIIFIESIWKRAKDYIQEADYETLDHMFEIYQEEWDVLNRPGDVNYDDEDYGDTIEYDFETAYGDGDKLRIFEILWNFNDYDGKKIIIDWFMEAIMCNEDATIFGITNHLYDENKL